MGRVFRLPDDPRRAGQDVEREIDLHLELKARELEEKGLSPDEARRAARASFGDLESVARECREVRGEVIKERRRRERWDDFWRDLRVTVRSLRRSPGFTLVAVLTLALGIGANAAIFTVLRSVLLAPLPYSEPDRLVQLWTDERSHGRAAPEWLTPPDFLDWQSGNKTFAQMAAYSGWFPDWTGAGEPVSLTGIQVSWSFFSVLGVKPALGRDFVPADDESGTDRVVILSDGIWRRRLGADPGVIGRSITLNGEPWTVVGVLGRDFRPPLPAPPDVWRPFKRPTTSGCGRSCIVLRAIGRLRPGVTVAQAQEDLATVAARLARDFPETNRGRGAWLIPLHEQLTGASRPALFALAAAVGFVLLIACVNLANLLLVRGAGRARELAVRAALGAGRGRLVGQLVIESLVLSLVGGGLGLLLAAAVRGGLASLVPAPIRQVQLVRLDPLVLAYTAAVSILAAGLFGLVPALRVAGDNLMTTLRSATRSSAGRDGRLRNGLVVVELSLSVVLLAGAGLLLRSFLLMQRADLGYRTERLVTASVLFPRVRYGEPTRAVTAIETLLERLRANPAIKAAEVTDQPPFTAGDQDISGQPVGELPPEGNNSFWYRTVSPGLISLLGMRIVEGRPLGPADRAGAGAVAIVNEEAKARFWHGHDPVGRELRSGDQVVTIVGVVANAHPDGARQPVKPELFLPIGQFPVRGVTVVLEPAGTDAAALEALRTALREVDPLIPVSATGSLERAAADMLEGPKIYAMLVAIVAAVALGLAALGVYGVMAYSVTQRQREIGVRLALGAPPVTIRRMVLRQGARLALIGAGVGLLGAVAVGRLVRTMLFGIHAWDPLTFAAVPLLLAAVSLLAVWIPAQRATHVDPLTAIRED